MVAEAEAAAPLPKALMEFWGAVFMASTTCKVVVRAVSELRHSELVTTSCASRLIVVW